MNMDLQHLAFKFAVTSYFHDNYVYSLYER